jgi:hypothetical protein
VLAGAGGALEVADERDVAAAAGDGARLHGREVLRLVDDGVPVARRRLAQQVRELVEQHEVVDGPRLVGGGRGRLAVQDVTLAHLEQVIGQALEQRRVAVEVAQQVLGGAGLLGGLDQPPQHHGHDGGALDPRGLGLGVAAAAAGRARVERGDVGGQRVGAQARQGVADVATQRRGGHDE